MQDSSQRRRTARRSAVVAVAALALSAAGAGVAGVAAGQTRGQPNARSAGVARGAQAVTRGHVRLVGRSSPARAARARFAPTGVRHPLPVLVPRKDTGTTARRTAVPRVQSSAVTAAATKVLNKFDGVNAIQNKRTAGFDDEPPDEGLGAGHGYVANFVNTTGAIYNRAGTMLGAPFYLNTFFKEDPATNTSDPRVFYDNQAQRWYATVVEYKFNKSFTAVAESHVDLASSMSADPTGRWRVFRIHGSNLNHANCPCLPDYPMLGFDHQNVYVTTAEFTSTLDDYHGAQLFAISKKQLLAGAAKPNMVWFQNLAVGGELAGHVQPALTYGNSPAEFLVSSTGNGASSSFLAVWAVTNPGSVTSGNGMPALGVRLISSEHYAQPPNARTPIGFCNGNDCAKGGEKTSGLLATDFDETFEVQYINGRVVTTLHTAVNIAGDSATRSGVAWFVIHPDVSGRVVTPNTEVARQGYLARKGQYLLYPHINMTSDGSMAVVFGLTAPNVKPAAAYAVAPPGAGFGPIQVYAAGRFPDNGFSGTPGWGNLGRWGDYSNGQIVPGTKQVWLATQYIPNKGDGNANWGNKIVHLQLP
ncbi:MAG: hypothetical protein QOK15_3069 [Nocardioidaceae bacterium]|jgi:hypothetical protein|nr:hypothetical protein [Nocardioidaceae bacterium]